MSGNDSELDLVTPEEVIQQRNLLERVSDHLGTDDEFFAALIANQIQLGRAMSGGGGAVSPDLSQEIDQVEDAVEDVETEVQQLRQQLSEVQPGDEQIVERLNQVISLLGGAPPPSTGSAQTIDTDSNQEDLDADDAFSLTVETEGATDVVLLVDDGNRGNTPPLYTLTQRVEVTEFGRFMFYDRLEETQARSVVDPAIPPRWQVVIRNATGDDSQPYQAHLAAIRREG